MAPTDKPGSPTDPATASPETSSSLTKMIHYVIVGLLIVAGLAYWALKPPTLNPMADSGAAEAMALVQTHRAQQAPTLRQAITDRVQTMARRRQGVRLGEWRVERQKGDIYFVKIFVREEGTRGWFEREYLWRVDVNTRSVDALTLPAVDLMPTEPEKPTPTSRNVRSQ